MPISVTCPNGHKLKVKSKLAGKVISCPKCKAPIEVQLSESGIMGFLDLHDKVGLSKPAPEARDSKSDRGNQSLGEAPSPSAGTEPKHRRETPPDGDPGSDRKIYGTLVPVGGGKSITLSKARILVGRHKSCDIALGFSSVSARHASLKIVGRYWFVEDNNSRNGVWVNGIRVAKQQLNPGDVVAFGTEKYTIRYSPAALTGAESLSTDSDSDSTLDMALLKGSDSKRTRKKVEISEEDSSDGVYNPSDTKKCVACHKRDQMGSGPNWMYCRTCAAKMDSTEEMIDKWVEDVSDRHKVAADIAVDHRPAKPKRQWYQWGVGALVLLGIVGVVVLVCVTSFLRPRLSYRSAIAPIQSHGGYAEGHARSGAAGVVFVGFRQKGPGLTDADLGELRKHLEKLPNLQGLDLSYTKITDAGLDHLKGLTSLERLYLRDTKVTDAGLERLQGLSRLSGLRLGGTQVTDAGLGHIEKLNKLEELGLNRTQVTDAGLVHLEGLTNLKNLFLLHTQVTARGIKGLQQTLPNCKIRHDPRL